MYMCTGVHVSCEFCVIPWPHCTALQIRTSITELSRSSRLT